MTNPGAAYTIIIAIIGSSAPSLKHLAMEGCGFTSSASSSDDDDSFTDGLLVPDLAVDALVDLLKIAKALECLLLSDCALDSDKVLNSLATRPAKLKHLDLSENVHAFQALQQYLRSENASELETLKIDAWPCDEEELLVLFQDTLPLLAATKLRSLSLQDIPGFGDDVDSGDDDDEDEDIVLKVDEKQLDPVAGLQGLHCVKTLQVVHLSGT